MKIKDFKRFLNREHPQVITNWRKIIFVSLFVTLFMTITEPFGLSKYKVDNMKLIIAGYGLVVFFVLFFNFFVVTKFIKPWMKKWR